MLPFNPKFSCSVGYLSSRDFFQNRTTRSFWTSLLTSPRGMHMRNSENTLSTPSGHSDHKQRNSAGSSATFPARHVHSTSRNGSRLRRPPAFAAVPQRPRSKTSELVVGDRQRKVAQMRNTSIWRHTKFMHSATTRTKLNNLALLTVSQPNTFVKKPPVFVGELK